MASLGGSKQQWSPLSDVASYVQTVAQSLTAYYDSFSLSGFDIDYENNLNSSGAGAGAGEIGTTEPTWLQAWCTIITNLKQVGLLARSMGLSQQSSITSIDL